MSKNLIHKIYLDDVLVKFSVFGRYHAVSAVWLALGMAINTMCNLSYVLIVEEVKYSCAHTNATFENISDLSEFSNVRNGTNAGCRDPSACPQWIYENPDSFVAEFQLACQEWKRTLVGTVHVFGYMIGIVIIGPLSDRFGRRTLAIATTATGALCGIAKSFASFYWIYVLFEFFEASIGDCYSPIYMLALEMVAPDARVVYTTMSCIGLFIGGVLFPMVRWLVPYWRTCLRVMYAPGLLYIVTIYMVDESPRWLLSKGRMNTVVENIKKAANLNKIEIKENLTLLSYESDTSLNFITVIKSTFKSRTLLKRFLVCIIWWNTCTLVNDGLLINSVSLPGSKYVNYAVASAIRLPAGIFVALILYKINRRKPLICSFVASAVLCTGLPFIPSNKVWLANTMYMITRFASGMFFKITYLFTPELFPTYTRNSMQALCSCIGRIGAILATQMPILMAYWSYLPIVIYAAMSLIAALVTLLMPDTAKTSLPDTVRQAEALGGLETRILTKDGLVINQRTRNNSVTFD